MRVSTVEQNLDLQRDALEGASCERLYEDTCSGSVTDRPGLAKALDHMRTGDALVVWKLDRIGRSLGHVVELVDALRAKGIGLKVLTGGIDTTSSTGRLVFGIFATLAEFERDLIKERTLAGLAAARARSRIGGRPRLMTRAKLRTALTMMADRTNVAGDVAEQLGISVSTLYAYVDGEGQAKPRARKLLYLEHGCYGLSGALREGILLYPSVDGEEISLDYQLPRARIRVCTLDLTRPWQHVHRRLLELAHVSDN